MSTVPKWKGYVPYVVAWVTIFLAVPLWRAFNEPHQPLWNVFLATFLMALVAGVFFGLRYLQKREVEVGEARFTACSTDD